MNKTIKIIIVAALVLVVTVVMWFKEKNKEIVLDTQKTENSSPSQTDSVSNETEAEVQEKLPKLIDLGAGKCIPCKMMAPILEEIKEEYNGKLDVIFIDVWENPEEAKKYKINLIPTQIFYDSAGKELFRHEGFYSKEDILEKYKELGIDF